MTLRDLIEEQGEKVLDAEVLVEYPGFGEDNYTSTVHDFEYDQDEQTITVVSSDIHT